MRILDIPTESQEQRCLFEWAALQKGKHPELGLLYAVPNGSFRHKATAGRLKAEGVKAGVPDVVLPVARGNFHGLYIELKRQKNSQTSDAQKDWIDALNAQGYLAIICRGWAEASDAIMQYLTATKEAAS